MSPRVVGRLTAPVALVSVLLLVIAVGSAWYVRNLQKSVSGPMANHVASMQAAQELEISVREVSSQFNRYLVTYDRKHLEPIPRLKARTAEALAAAEASANTPPEQALMRRVRQGYQHFFDEYEAPVKDPQKGGVYAKVIELTDTVLVKEILEPAHGYLQMNEGMLAKASEANQELADRLTVGLVALGLCGATGGMLGGWVIASSVRRSILLTEQRLRSTAAELDEAVPGRPPVGVNGKPADALEQVSVSVSAVLKRLRQTERDALRAEQLAWVGQMAAGLAHEVRNPLMAIKLLVQATAERANGSPFRTRDLEVLEEEIVRLEQIVSGFLDFARPPRPQPRAVDVRELVDRVVAATRARAELQAVEVEVTTAGPTPVVSADPNQLRQVVFNLLFNALDAQPRGGRVRVKVAADAGPDGRPGVALAVEDEGPGLPADLGERIFEPFVSTKEAGLGLGLSICRRIAESHRGTLAAADRPAGGAAFTLRLPAEQG